MLLRTLYSQIETKQFWGATIPWGRRHLCVFTKAQSREIGEDEAELCLPLTLKEDWRVISFGGSYVGLDHSLAGRNHEKERIVWCKRSKISCPCTIGLTVP